MPASASRGTTRSASWRNSGGGFRIGLLSDCGAELAECWSPTAFVPLVFSWQERCRKPDPRLHAPVARRLAVHPEKCSPRTRWSRGAARYRVDPDDAVCEYTVDDPAGVLYRLGTMWGPHVMRADALTTRRITSADGWHRG